MIVICGGVTGNEGVDSEDGALGGAVGVAVMVVVVTGEEVATVGVVQADFLDSDIPPSSGTSDSYRDDLLFCFLTATAASVVEGSILWCGSDLCVICGLKKRVFPSTSLPL